MSHFDVLPDELIYDMCKQWNNRTLLNMSASYSRVYQVCSEIIKQRKINEEKIIEEKRIKLKKMTVATLKDILRANNLKIPRLKADMIRVLIANRYQAE